MSASRTLAVGLSAIEVLGVNAREKRFGGSDWSTVDRHDDGDR